MKEKKIDEKPKKGRMIMWAFIYSGVFIAALIIGVVSKFVQPSWTKDFTAEWSDSVGTVYKDITYGEKDANKFDLYVPADNTKENYGLVVYLHAGGFTAGDKSGDEQILKWLCSKGYIAAGINYTLRDEAHPEASVYSQSMEIKEQKRRNSAIISMRCPSVAVRQVIVLQCSMPIVMKKLLPFL